MKKMIFLAINCCISSLIITDMIAMERASQLNKRPKASVKTIKHAQEALRETSKQKRIQAANDAQLEAETQMIKSQRLKQCFDLMMIIDDLGEEGVGRETQTMMIALRESLKRKSFPILVSTNTVHECAKLASTFEVGGHIYNLIYGITDLFNDDWYCYDHSQANIMLLVPKNYLNNFAQHGETLTQQMNKCGFNTTYLKKIGNLSSPNLVRYFTNNKSIKQNNVSLVQAIESMFTIPTKPNSPTWNIFLTGHGLPNERIAGLPVKTFQELLQCFQKINCSLLYYLTCFGGGINLIHVTEELARLQVNFMVIAQGINEHVAEVTIQENKIEDFFTRAENFFGNSAAFIKEKQQSNQKDPIAFMIEPLEYTKGLPVNVQPFIYIPSIGIFSVIDVDKEVKIITESNVKTHEFENLSIDCTDKNIKNIIIYPDYINIPIKINLVDINPNVISPTTQKLKNNDLHIFKEIIDEGPLYHPNWQFNRSNVLLKTFLASNLKYWPVTFVIKKLYIPKRNIFYENVIIHCSGIKNEKQISVYVLLSEEKKDYAMQPLVIEYDDLHDLLAGGLLGGGKWRGYLSMRPLEDISQSNNSDFFHHIPPYLRQLPLVAHVLNSQEQKPTLARIIEALESYTSKSTHVQEPGKLKSILLKQKEMGQKQIFQEKK